MKTGLTGTEFKLKTEDTCPENNQVKTGQQPVKKKKLKSRRKVINNAEQFLLPLFNGFEEL